MIPTDLAARLRLLTESVVNPVSPVHEVSADLPELPVGQRFIARVESAQPDGTFRALVAGRSLSLALPQSARPGDTLDLVVAARTPRLIIAESADDSVVRQSSAAPSVPAPALSRAGQIISRLLHGEGHAPRPAMIARAAPLLSEPPLQAARLAPVLQQVIAESGLFYESHQAQWIAARYPAEALAREPQSRLARTQRATDAAAASPAAPTEEAAEMRAARGAEPASVRSPAATSPDLSVELQSLVQQQLDAAATQHIVWRGEIWPGHVMQWEIAAEGQGHDTSEGETAEQWTTSLALTLPSLGEVNVLLSLTPAKVSLGVTASEGAAILKKGLGELAASFAAAGLPPLTASVASHEAA